MARDALQLFLVVGRTKNARRSYGTNRANRANAEGKNGGFHHKAPAGLRAARPAEVLEWIGFTKSPENVHNMHT